MLFYFIIVLIILILYARLSVGRCKCNTYLAGKTALITGGNSGIGYQTALALAGRGCRVIIADRDNCDASKAKIIEQTGNTNIVIKQFNLASLSSVRKLAKEINETEERLDILINNAGASGLGNRYTEDGLHAGMQVNHFGGFLLTHLLIDLLKMSAPSRIIFVSSYLSFTNNLTLENLNYPKNSPQSIKSEFRVYSNSKLCNIITANGFAEKLKGTGITVNSLHPGLMRTPIFARYLSSKDLTPIVSKLFLHFLFLCFSKTVEEGAQTTIHLALSKKFESLTGRFSVDCKSGFIPKKAKDKSFARGIWEASERYVNLAPEEKLSFAR